MEGIQQAVNDGNADQLVRLLSDNFNNDTGKLEKLKELLQKSTSVITSLINQSISQAAAVCIDVSDKPEDLVSATKLENAQFFEPRGRFNVSVLSTGILLEGKQSNAFIPWNSILHIAKVPNHASTKKEGEDLLVLKLSNSIRYNGKDTWNFVWVLSKTPPKPSNNTQSLLTESEIVSNAISTAWKDGKIVGIDKRIFQTVSSQKSFLRCHNGVQEGAIYPLSCGIVFIKPLVFIPNEDISSITAGRGGGSGNTRYVDLQVSLVLIF